MTILLGPQEIFEEKKLCPEKIFYGLKNILGKKKFWL